MKTFNMWCFNHATFYIDFGDIGVKLGYCRDKANEYSNVIYVQLLVFGIEIAF